MDFHSPISSTSYPKKTQKIQQAQKVLSILSLSILVILQTTFVSASSLIPSPPSIEGSSYLLMDAQSGSVLMSSNEKLAIPPASLTKIMTSYVAEYELEQGNISMEDLVPISIKAWQKGGSKMYVKEGTRVKLIDLLRGVIIQSGNDASIALAEYIAGSEDAFVDLMNQHAQRLGMTQTHFMNSTGWPADNHYSTAHDLAILSRALIRDFPQHYSLYAEKYFTYNNIKQANRNSLLKWSETVDGIKTGHTEEAGYCLVASAEENGMRLISVITGADSDYARAKQTQKMLTYGFRFFETSEIHPSGSQISTVRVWKGAEDELKLTTQDAIYLTYPRGQYAEIKQDVNLPENLLAPINAGDQIGFITFTLGGETLGSTPLIAASNIEKAGFLSTMFDTLWLFFAGLFK